MEEKQEVPLEIQLLFQKYKASAEKFKKTNFRKESARVLSLKRIEKLRSKLLLLLNSIPEEKKGIVKVEYNIELEI